MQSPRSLGWLRCGTTFLAGPILALSMIAADTPPPPATPLSGLVKTFTEKRTEPAAPVPAAQPIAQQIAQPVAQPIVQPAEMAVSRDATTKQAARTPTPSLASLPPPKAASGPWRILLVDDDWSDNNNPDSSVRERLSGSDEIFRALVAAAVGNEASAWSVEIAETNQHGPAFERLRDFNVVLWYTGGSYGGGSDNVAVLSVEDEKTARRYLQETGGSFMLVSPGYVNNLSYGTTWADSAHPFLKDVAGVTGFSGLVQRFAAGTVLAPDGSRFTVEPTGAAETQFSAVNANGAAIVFTASLDPMKTAKEPVPVAVAHPFAGGRFVYVGFTFENIAEKERPKAFDLLLAAAVGSKGAAAPLAGVAIPVVRTPVANLPGQAPGPGTPTVQVSGTPIKTIVSWTLPSIAVANASLSRPAQTAKNASAPPPGLTVTVERQAQGVWGYGNYWQAMAVPTGASQVVDDAAYPGTARSYRVTVTDANGATSFKEVQYTVPSIKDPESITARLQSDYSVILTWPEVPGVTKYRVQLGPGARGIEPTIVSGATEWRSPALDGFKRSWSVTSLYERDGEYVSLSDRENWPSAITQGIDQYFLVAGTFTIHTGNDNKELPSSFTIKLYINGGETQPEDSANPNPLRLQYVGHSFGSNTTELKVNSSADFQLSTSVDTVWAPQKNNLANIQQHGLRIVITYQPNFPLDAWKIDQLTLTLKFQDRDQITNYHRTGHRYFSPGMDNKTITFPNVAKLLTAGSPQLDLITDGSLQPIAQP